MLENFASDLSCSEKFADIFHFQNVMLKIYDKFCDCMFKNNPVSTCFTTLILKNIALKLFFGKKSPGTFCSPSFVENYILHCVVKKI